MKEMDPFLSSMMGLRQPLVSRFPQFPYRFVPDKNFFSLYASLLRLQPQIQAAASTSGSHIPSFALNSFSPASISPPQQPQQSQQPTSKSQLQFGTPPDDDVTQATTSASGVIYQQPSIFGHRYRPYPISPHHHHHQLAAAAANGMPGCASSVAAAVKKRIDTSR